MTYMDPTFDGMPSSEEAESIRQNAIAARRSAGGITTLEQSIAGGNIPAALGIIGAVTPGAVGREYYEQAGAQASQAGYGALAAIPALMKIGSKVAPFLGAAFAGASVAGIFGDEGAPGTEIQPSGGTPAPLQGPGLKEPGSPYLLKEWHVSYPKGRIQYYLVQRMSLNGAVSKYIMMYKTWDKTWKWWKWRAPHLAVIGKNMPSHKMITRLRRNLKRHKDDARTITQLTDPVGYAKGLGYKKAGRRR